MSMICTMEGPFDYTSETRAKLSALFNVNDYYGQMAFGGRWPLVKRAACKIATDAIDSPFLFQVRNLDVPEAAALDPVLCRIWGPNENAGAAILGRPCWNKLKGCLGSIFGKKKTAEVVSTWGDFENPSRSFDIKMHQEKTRNPNLTDGEAAVIVFFSMVTEVPKPSPDAGEGYYTKIEKNNITNKTDITHLGPMPLAEVWELKRQELIEHLKQLGLWDNVKKAAAARQGAVASAQAAQSTTAMQEGYRGISFDFYPMDAAKISDEVVEEAEIRVLEEKAAALEAENKETSNLVLPIAAAAAALFAFS